MLASILFVDDDVNVLTALRRMLHPMRHEWQMSFATGAQEALAKLAQAPFDVVVSDVRMPVMTGIELLAEVRRRYPHTARIILSGQSSREATARASGCAHQYLSKPCDPEVLKRAIGTVCDLQRLLSNLSMRRVVSRLESIPSLPRAYQEVIQQLDGEEVSLPRVGRAIAQDPGMSAKVLQLVNSSFFGLPRPHSSPEEAAVLLGVDTLRSLILGAHIFTQFEEKVVPELPLASFWTHSIRVSRVAKAIAVEAGAAKGVAVHAATAGLLHDIGVLAIAVALPAEFRELMAIAGRERNFLAAESKVLGVTHAQAGAYLMGLWGLPDPIVEAILLHHSPSVGHRGGLTPLAATHVADALCHDPLCPEATICNRYVEELGLGSHVPAWESLAASIIASEGPLP